MNYSNKQIIIIAAVAKNGVIGKNGTLPWHLKADLQNFKNVTKGETVIMGSNTYKSIGKPLPNRQNIVITSHPENLPQTVTAAKSLQEAINKTTTNKAFIIGGARVFQESLPQATHLILTKVEANIDGDTYFKEALDLKNWQLETTTPHPADEENDYPFTIEYYKRP